MIDRIKTVHEAGIVHRDIKPDNFLVGTDPNQIYIIDFGLSTRYKTDNDQHVPFVDGKGFTGTARYASLFAHRGYQQSRRDDLIAIGHVLIYLLKGRLPW